MTAVVRDVMSAHPISVRKTASFKGIAVRLRECRVSAFPVVDAAGRLTGIVSRTDVLTVFDRPDEEIRLEIIGQVIPRLSEPSWYSVRVKDGIATLEGTPETISVGHKVLDQVRHVQGVVAVRDRLFPLPPVPAAPGPYF
jgi:CBS domain-containing protein